MKLSLPRHAFTIFLSAIFACAVFLTALPASAASAQTRKKVVMVVINDINVQDLLTPKRTNITALLDDGAAGLMNVRAAGGVETGSYYLSLGAGARANAGKYGKLGFNATERLPEKYYRGLLTAREVGFANNGEYPPRDSVVNLGVNLASSNSYRYHRNIVPGLLGEMLDRSDLQTAVVGNADTLDQVHREITLIPMDFKGETDAGDVSRDMTRIDKGFPGGLRTDVDKLAEATLELYEEADFTAVEFGDTSRIKAQRAQMRKSIWLKEREKSLAQADRFIGRLMRSLPMDRTMLIVTGPRTLKVPGRGRDNLVPIIVSGVGGGVLVSDTTRRGGVVANMDVAPTILDYLGLPIPIEMAGGVMGSRPGPGKDIYAFLNGRYSGIYELRQLRNPFLVTYSVLRVLGVLLAMIAIAATAGGRPIRPAYTGAIQIFLLFLLAVPLAGFLQIPLNETNMPISLFSLAGLAAIIGSVSFFVFRNRPLAPLVLIAAATALLITIDTVTGAVLADRSFFGSDIMSGGRFYGVGNTLMGILAATSVFAAAGLIELSRAGKKYLLWAMTALLFIIAAIVGHQQLGANVGGLITLTASALIFLHVIGRAPFNARAVLPKLAAFALFVPAVLRFDPFRADGASHAGKAMAVIQEQGGSAIMDIIIRKINMNIRGTFSYNALIAVLMILFLVWLIRLLGERRGPWINKEFGDLTGSFAVMLWTAFIAYTFNDTGSVAAQSILTYAVVPIVYVMLSSPPKDEEGLRIEDAAPAARL